MTREVACPLSIKLISLRESVVSRFSNSSKCRVKCLEISHKLFIMHYHALTITFYSVNADAFNLFADAVFRHSNLFLFYLRNKVQV